MVIVKDSVDGELQNHKYECFYFLMLDSFTLKEFPTFSRAFHMQAFLYFPTGGWSLKDKTLSRYDFPKSLL